MILCAGRGERMRPLTDMTPKPLLEVRGMPLLGWHLQRLQQAGFRHIVINHCWLGQQIEDYVGNLDLDLKVCFSEEKVALETAGGIVKALPLLGNDPFAVVNGDIFSDFDFAQLAPLSNSTLAHLVLVTNPSHNLQGDFVLQQQQVQASGPNKLTFSGIAVYSPMLFSGLKPSVLSPLAPLLREAMNKHVVSGEHYQGQWCDVGTPQRLQQLNKG
ncbi:nucleotidyltransferase family protein [Alteromonadaceae bacterium BrNp21-10]|nr:nucleotidyltransferase family protein [Alteromonadaceae bacterium BrNp21-10]